MQVPRFNFDLYRIVFLDWLLSLQIHMKIHVSNPMNLKDYAIGIGSA